MVPDETHQSNENRTREEKIMSITRTRPAVWTLTVLLLIGMTVPACAPKDTGTQEPRARPANEDRDRERKSDDDDGNRNRDDDGANDGDE